MCQIVLCQNFKCWDCICFSWWLNASAIERDIYIVHCTLGLGEISLVEREFDFKAGLVSLTF